MTWHRSIERRLSLCLIALLILPAEALASTSLKMASQTSSAGQQLGRDSDRADASSSQAASAPTATPQQPVPPVSQQPMPDAPQPKATPSVASNQAAQTPAQSTAPLGTAAAPDTHIDGVAASTPSGAAIAPAKQRRVAKFSIRTALIVGAVVAVGIVVGASAASPSHP